MANRTDAVERNKVNPGQARDAWPPLYTVKWTREHFPIMFFTEGRHSDRSAVGLTGSYETLQIDQAEVRTKCANSILVWTLFWLACGLCISSETYHCTLCREPADERSGSRVKNAGAASRSPGQLCSPFRPIPSRLRVGFLVTLCVSQRWR